ncbi:MAG: type II toxin-antitoxin system HicB family antitoxin [Armatimonadota bacterium]
MRTFIAIVERCPETGLYVGWIPGIAGAHSQAESLDELHQNLREVLDMLQEDGELQMQSEFVGTQVITVA